MTQWHHQLLDRTAHRQPVDAHFAAAFEWMRKGPPAAWAPVLELGPGPEADLTDALRRQGREVFTVDVKQSLTTARDYTVQPGESLPFPQEHFGMVLAREVLEHIFELRETLAEIHRVLKPGGRLWFSVPFVFPYHDIETGDYWRITHTGWQRLLEEAGYAKIAAKPTRFLFESWQLPISILGWAEK